MDAVVRKWLDSKHDCMNSMETIERLVFTEGRMQVKWWKLRGHIIVHNIELDASYIGHGIFTDFCKKMLQWSDVRDVQLASVCDANIVLLGKLKELGWKRPSYHVEDHDLFLTLE